MPAGIPGEEVLRKNFDVVILAIYACTHIRLFVCMCVQLILEVHMHMMSEGSLGCDSKVPSIIHSQPGLTLAWNFAKHTRLVASEVQRPA